MSVLYTWHEEKRTIVLRHFHQPMSVSTVTLNCIVQIAVIQVLAFQYRNSLPKLYPFMLRDRALHLLFLPSHRVTMTTPYS